VPVSILHPIARKGQFCPVPFAGQCPEPAANRNQPIFARLQPEICASSPHRKLLRRYNPAA